MYPVAQPKVELLPPYVVPRRGGSHCGDGTATVGAYGEARPPEASLFRSNFTVKYGVMSVVTNLDPRGWEGGTTT